MTGSTVCMELIAAPDDLAWVDRTLDIDEAACASNHHAWHPPTQGTRITFLCGLCEPCAAYTVLAPVPRFLICTGLTFGVVFTYSFTFVFLGVAEGGNLAHLAQYMVF